MAFSFTPGQKAAIEARGTSLLVSAAAGSGKTRVLTERLMSYVTAENDPVDIDKFLIITYTRAAAAELRGRIIEELGRRAAASPLDARLRRQQSLCYHARIGTIHSFCTDILRENCHLLGLSPAFKVMDEDRAKAMKESALDALLEEKYSQIGENKAFQSLVDTVGAGRDDSRLSAVVLSLYEKLRSHPYPDDWAREQLRQLALEGVSDVSDTQWGCELLGGIRRSAEHWSKEMDEAALAVKNAGGKIEKAYFESLEETAAAMRSLVRALGEGWDRAREFLPVPFPRLGALRGGDETGLADRVKLSREGCKKAAAGFASALAEDSETQLKDLRFMAPAMSELMRLTLDFDRAYADEKKRLSYLDFSDLEHFAAQLLVDKETGAPTWAAVELSHRFTEIMVDEYQDVNAVQDMIFSAVSRGGKNLFMVGDVKQSIYRFRLADPSIFLEKYRLFEPYSAALPPDALGQKILLQENFRSRKCVLDASNLVFTSIMSTELGELDYDESASLKFGAIGYPEGTDEPAELCIVSPPEGEDDEDTPEKSELEARFVASKINAMMEARTPVYENGAARACRWSDFVLLMRSPSGKGPLFHRVLAEAGIPVQSQQGSGFFASVEITAAVNMLAIIDDPHADISLISVLRSPAFGFDGDLLSEIRAADKSADFYGALCVCAEKNERCSRFLSWLNALREDSADMSLDALLWRIYFETDLLTLCSAMTGGDARRANLMQLFEYARKFEETGYRGVYRFVIWLRRLAESGQEPSPGDSGDAVRILSIHKSKGLEFPFVFLCDLAHQFNKSDSRDNVLIHTDLGLGPKKTDAEQGIEYPTIARRAIERRMTDEMLSEEMRVLYVGMTRAKERLFLTCAWKNAEEALEKLKKGLTSPIAPEILRGAPSFSRWVAMAALLDESLIKISIMTDVSAAGEADAEAEGAKPTEEAEKASEDIGRKLSYVYPYESAVALPSKLTATEMKGDFAAQYRDSEAAELVSDKNEKGAEFPDSGRKFRKPDFSGKRRLSAAERGTATHLFLQFMDYAKAGSLDALDGEVKRLTATGHLSPQQAEAVDRRAVMALFSSPVGKRMKQADELRREFRFTLLERADKYFDAPEDDRLLLQGVIDCFIVENGEITIIDYKTDRVTCEEAPLRAQLYAGQLKAYAGALERICEKPVKQALLYFLRTGSCEEVKIR